MQANNNQKLSYYQRNKERLIQKEKERYNLKRDEIRAKDRTRYKNNKESILERNKEWKRRFEDDNGVKYSETYYKQNIEKYAELNKQWTLNNPGERTKHSNEWRKNNPEKAAECDKKTYQKNKHKRNAKRSEKYHTNPNFKIAQLISGRIRKAIKSGIGTKSERTTDLVGCNIDFLKVYLESLFQEGMTWENNTVGGWHIDHIIPCASFDLQDPKEQKKCFHYTNLRPMWGTENISKSSVHEGQRYYYLKS